MNRVVPAVLLYARAQGRVLMLHRNAKTPETDIHYGKWNGLGGKLERDESPLEAARREWEEESGLSASGLAFQCRGTLWFPAFKTKSTGEIEDWVVWIYTLEGFGTLAWEKSRGVEGELEWIDEHRVIDLNLWEGDRDFLPSVLRGETVFGTYWYRDGKLMRMER